MALRADDVDLGRDRVLVEQYQEGDVAAFEDLYRRYYGRLFRFCLRRTGDPHEAEELTQEAFARAYRAMPMLRGERRFYPWLSVIASRLCIDSHRRAGRTEPTADVDAGLVSDPDHLAAAVDHDLLHQALERLNDRHREVLHLREREGWSYQRIADHYGITMGAVEGLLFRARQALRREFLSVAGPEAGLAAASPLALPLLGRLSRRVNSWRLRMADWTAWANIPAIAANTVGAAMVVTTAAGLVTSVVSPTAPKPMTLLASTTVAETRSTADVVGVAVAHNRAAIPAATVAKPAAAAPQSQWVAPGIKPQTSGAVADTTKLTIVYDDSGKDRTEEQPVAVAVPHTPVVAGVDPNKIADDTAKNGAYYVDQLEGEQP